MENEKSCGALLPCGHGCSCTSATPHWRHVLERYLKKYMKELCLRQHKCPKQCWESCRSCRHPVAAQLTCRHDAELPCCAVDSHKCQELCEKIVSSEGHVCGKECWENCRPCMVPVSRKCPCSHQTIIPCYANDSSYKCKHICGKTVDCKFKHKCEKECWELCVPCVSSVQTTLPCGHKVTLPCHVDVRMYKCMKCEKILCANNHRCRKACREECGPCYFKISVQLPCSHSVILTCGENTETYKCKDTCSKLCSRGHKCPKQCWEKCPPCQCTRKENP